MDSEKEDQISSEFGFPLTPFGAAGFIHVSGTRLFITSLIFACTCSIILVWGMMSIYVPVLVQAFNNSSENSELAEGVYYSGHSSQSTKLGSNTFLEIWAVKSISVQTPHTSDIRVHLANDRIRIKSLLGYYLDIHYPEDWFVKTGKASLLAFWGATKIGFPFLAGLVICVIILTSWTVVSFFYAFFVYVLANLFKRNPGLSSSFKLALCGSYFGGIIFSISAGLYVLDYISLLVVTAFLPGQFIASLCFLFLSVICLPRDSGPEDLDEPQSNPFTPDQGDPFNKSSNSVKSKSSLNPFD